MFLKYFASWFKKLNITEESEPFVCLIKHVKENKMFKASAASPAHMVLGVLKITVHCGTRDKGITLAWCLTDCSVPSGSAYPDTEL